mmetsp:Transcript_6374/g.12224  ORF Transcript_6374/g.12224 Transcript_6374/m.12224 type:complete len:212 (+) Transcript_6374:2032-2667(+)
MLMQKLFPVSAANLPSSIKLMSPVACFAAPVAPERLCAPASSCALHCPTTVGDHGQSSLPLSASGQGSVSFGTNATGDSVDIEEASGEALPPQTCRIAPSTICSSAILVDASMPKGNKTGNGAPRRGGNVTGTPAAPSLSPRRWRQPLSSGGQSNICCACWSELLNAGACANLCTSCLAASTTSLSARASSSSSVGTFASETSVNSVVAAA